MNSHRADKHFNAADAIILAAPRPRNIARFCRVDCRFCSRLGPNDAIRVHVLGFRIRTSNDRDPGLTVNSERCLSD